MKKNIFIISIILIFLSPCFNQIVTKKGSLNDYKDTVYSFDESEFFARLTGDYKTIIIKYNSKSYKKDFSLKCDSYIEQLSIKKVDKTLYWFCCESLGFQQYFIWNLTTDKIYEPFCDMKKNVYISKIDYSNQILFGDTWNSDKEVMPNSKVELYLFSTAKQTHYKISEKYGESYTITLLGNNKIQYNEKDGKLIEFDYSEWINVDTLYTASSFLTEGKTLYSPDNLASVEGLPWASANGYGINDTIQIKTLSYDNLQLSFYNGFQNKSRPDLYKANSRAKKITIKNLENGKTTEFILKDTSEMQRISLKDLNLDKNVFLTLEITILEVYQGEKYKDLCIQAIIPAN